MTTYFSDWCLSICTNLDEVVTIQIRWTGCGIKHSRSRDQPWVTDETISRTTMFFLVKSGTCFKRQFGSLWLCIVWMNRWSFASTCVHPQFMVESVLFIYILYLVFCVFCLSPASYVPNIANVSGLFILDCPLWFSLTLI